MVWGKSTPRIHQHTIEKMTSTLTEIILSKQTKNVDATKIATLKKEIKKLNRLRNEQKADYPPLQLKRQIDLAKQCGSSSWLPQGFHLHKGEFRDAICLRYGWTLPNTTRLCNCGKPFQIDHAMTCHMGGFRTIRHNEIRGMTAYLLTD